MLPFLWSDLEGENFDLNRGGARIAVFICIYPRLSSL